MTNCHTNVHFDYGGYYSEEHEWISGTSLYAISLRTSCLEEISYSMLVDKICRKIAIGETTAKLKLSYSLSKARRESYIVDNEDVYVYLTSLDTEGLKPVLHVELFNDLEENQMVEQVSRAERRSSVGVNYGDMVSNRIADDNSNDGIVTIFRAGGGAQEMNEPVIEDAVEENGDKGTDGNGNVDIQNVGSEDCGMDNQVDDVFDGRHEYVEIRDPLEISQFVEEWEDGTDLEINQEFSSKEALQDLVKRAANKHCFGVETYKSDTERLILRCRQASVGCKWYIRAARTKSSSIWTIRVHRRMHTCSRAEACTSSSSRQRGTQRLVASMLHEDYPGVVDTPTPKNIMSIVQGRLGLQLSYSTALRGKKQHVSDVRGSPEQSYKLLYHYLYMLEKVNHGTKTSVKLDEDKRFKYLFIALGASIEGFTAMRKVIVVDATFLKTVYGGMLVFATAQDPNHHHYPIAFGVIDSEKDASWRWFFENLKTVIPDVPGLVFISDRHASIIKAVMEVYPSAKHGHCIWHLSQNVRGKVKNDKDDVAKKFRECAHLYTKSDFDREYAEFKSRFPKAREYLDKSIELDKWTRSYFEGDKYNIDTSNSAESMNSVFKKARKYPLLSLIDAILEKFSEWFNLHRNESGSASDIKKVVPFVENILHNRCATAALLSVNELNGFELEYNVTGLDGKTYLVDLRRKSCSCRCFDIDKYPCVHAIAATRSFMKKKGRKESIQIYDLCSKYYLIETWALAYYKTIYLVPHVSDWSIPDHVQQLVALPPKYTTRNGRNQEVRFPSTGERRSRKRRNKSVPGINLEQWLQPERPED